MLASTRELCLWVKVHPSAHPREDLLDERVFRTAERLQALGFDILEIDERISSAVKVRASHTLLRRTLNFTLPSGADAGCWPVWPNDLALRDLVHFVALRSEGSSN